MSANVDPTNPTPNSYSFYMERVDYFVNPLIHENRTRCRIGTEKRYEFLNWKIYIWVSSGPNRRRFNAFGLYIPAVCIPYYDTWVRKNCRTVALRSPGRVANRTPIKHVVHLAEGSGWCVASVVCMSVGVVGSGRCAVDVVWCEFYDFSAPGFVDCVVSAPWSPAP